MLNSDNLILNIRDICAFIIENKEDVDLLFNDNKYAEQSIYSTLLGLFIYNNIEDFFEIGLVPTLSSCLDNNNVLSRWFLKYNEPKNINFSKNLITFRHAVVNRVAHLEYENDIYLSIGKLGKNLDTSSVKLFSNVIKYTSGNKVCAIGDYIATYYPSGDGAAFYDTSLNDICFMYIKDESPELRALLFTDEIWKAALASNIAEIYPNITMELDAKKEMLISTYCEIVKVKCSESSIRTALSFNLTFEQIIAFLNAGNLVMSSNIDANIPTF